MSHSNHAAKVLARESSAAPTNTPDTADAPCTSPAACDIRRRAYEISLTRNGGPGDETSDWTQAEQELSSLDEIKN